MTAATLKAAASPWVARFLPEAPAGGRLLDVACGGGRHLRLALERGWLVTGVDRDLAGVADLGAEPRAELIAADLEAPGAVWPLGERRFEAVVVTNYLWRPILPAILSAVAEDGLLIYETFAVGNARFGRPANPDFLLRPNELLELATPRLTVLAFEGLERRETPAVTQRIAAVGPAHPWATSPPPL